MIEDKFEDFTKFKKFIESEVLPSLGKLKQPSRDVFRNRIRFAGNNEDIKNVLVQISNETGNLFTLDHLESKWKSVQEEKNKRTNRGNNETIETSFYEDSNFIYEQTFNNGKATFARWDGKKVEYVGVIELENGTKIIPILDDAIKEGAVLLPSETEEYGTEHDLYFEIVRHIHRYLDVSPEFEQLIVPMYIFLTWVYDIFNVLPYLRVLGDTGSGKSRFLDIIGGLAYKPCIVSGCITPAPIYRMIRKWNGTIILDEADFKDSSEKSEVIKIFNCGFERKRLVVGCDMKNPDKLQYLPTFCSKIFSTRFTFYDKALESRCLTEKMMETIRGEIPNVLSKPYYEAEKKLRNNLLMYRFRNRNKLDPNKVDFDFGEIEPRLKQVMAPFSILLSGSDSLKDKFKIFLERHNKELIDERSTTFEGKIISTLLDLKESGKEFISSLDISEKMKDYGFKQDDVSPQI